MIRIIPRWKRAILAPKLLWKYARIDGLPSWTAVKLTIAAIRYSGKGVTRG